MKCSTTSSKLFNTNNKEQLPEWFNDIDVEIKERESYNLEFDKKGSFADKTSVYREELNATPREMVASVNNTKLITDAKIQLAKFLVGKYYKVETRINNNIATLDVRLQNTPAEFKFIFSSSNGKVIANDTFIVTLANEDYEYPFSQAGFDECLEDIKNDKPKSAKVDGLGQFYMINREEIIRRYNGKLREATDKINELLSNGEIIGIGSNTYGTTYDVDYLFPQLEKEACEKKIGAFEFAPNKEHVAAKPVASIKELRLQASKMLSNLFNDYTIHKCTKDNNELLVNVDILNNYGVRNTCHFCFGIEDEKLASIKYLEMNDERITVDQLFEKMNMDSKLLDSYVKESNGSTKKIYRGIILTKREIQSKLSSIVSGETLEKIINSWHSRNLITAINLTTFVTEKTFEELLTHVQPTLLTAEEKEVMQQYMRKFGEGLDVTRNDVEDTGVRNDSDIESSQEIQLFNLNSYLNKHFKNFKVSDFDGSSASLIFVDPDSGVENRVMLSCNFEGNNVDEVFATINGKNVELNQVSQMFGKSEVLSKYLEGKGNLTVHSIILTKSKINRKLADFVSQDNIENIIESWYSNGYIVDIDTNTIGSRMSLETLLNKSNINILSDEDMAQIQLAKKYFGEKQMFNRESIKDTGVRIAEEFVSDDTLLVKANEFLSRYFRSFEPIDLSINRESISYTANVFDENTGLSMTMNFILNNDGNKITDAYTIVNNEKIAMKNIRKAFVSNKVLSKFIELNPGKKTKSPMIITVKQLQSKLKDVAKIDSEQEINNVISNWVNTGKANKIAQNLIASKYTLEQLISLSNLRVLSDEEIKQKIEKAHRNKLSKLNKSYINDNDTRELVDTWSSERTLSHIKNEISKIYADYEILNVDIDDNNYKISARVVNPMVGIRQKAEFEFEVVNGKPNNIFKVVCENKINNEALNRYIAYNGATNKVGKSIISKSDLKNKLLPLINKQNVSAIINYLQESKMLTPVSDSLFASEYSVNEMVNYLNENNKLDLDAGQDNIANSQRDDNSIKISDKRVFDNDSRPIEAKEKELSPAMKELRDKILKIASNSHSKKLITNKKLNSIKTDLETCNCEQDLEKIWKDLKRYL